MTLLSAMPSASIAALVAVKGKKQVKILHQSVKLISPRLGVLQGLVVAPNLSFRPNPDHNFRLAAVSFRRTPV